jgi:UDP-2,4-diacetamido-2,4,6-trideoxy-beta-L-altropyranose hydrolase
MFGPLAIFRCDGGPTMGGGHVARCLAAADELRGRGWRCAFAVSAETAATMPTLAKSGHEVWALPLAVASESEPDAMAAHWREGAALLIVDHYRRDAAFETACRPWTKHILIIDDLADRPHDCEFLLDPTLGRKTSDYSALAPASAQLLLGPTYALLRPEFAVARPGSLERRRRQPGLRRVLLSFGSTDPFDATGACLDEMTRVLPDLSVDVALGAAAPHLASVRRRVEGRPGARLHIETDRMAELMAAADCALGGAGSTSWERCCLGLPAVVAILADNQRGIGRALSDSTAAVVTGPWGPSAADFMVQELVALTSQRLAKMSSAAAAICDGTGIFCLANAIDPLRQGLA